MDCRESAPSELIAAFDLDHTLLKPTKGVFPKTRDDAVLVFPDAIRKKFTTLRRKHYKIVIFTNQKGIPKRMTLEDLYYKIDKYLPRGKDIDVYVSYATDRNRKPSPGMFDKCVVHNGAIRDIFYVGDAAGREGDFSASDLQFAHNCGIKFYTPEQFFLDQDAPAGKLNLLAVPEPINLKHRITKQTVIILVGYPASGKSTFVKHLLKTHEGAVIINNDTIKNVNRSLKMYKQALADGSPYIIIDNTNPTIMNRVQYVEPAKDVGYKVYAIRFAVDYDTAMHLNWYRAYTTDSALIPEIAYRSFRSRLQEITDTEGFDHVDQYVPKFDPEPFEYSF